MTVRILVSGARALFTRPEFAVDRVTYDLITPSAARHILDAIHWRPAIRWTVQRIHILAPLRLDALDAGWDGGRARAVVLCDGRWLIEARCNLTAQAAPSEIGDRHIAMVERRIRQQHFATPLDLGHPRMPATVEWLDPTAPVPASSLAKCGTIDLGWLLRDRDGPDGTPRYFRAQAVRGVVDVPPPEDYALRW